ncbi:hypothetical protein [Pseudoalteromonas sp. BSi20495]|uniref:hypothetical protein n=1 Tax=Pseudoalteromonas sp. BSi20495 TaxID=386429 RepID=UPI00023159C0|nr:hypothetical protein [Pseudoalteromonas sp. BSi20495]GAA78191.1 hypothetical protein P20495_0682 [Pseudoalteromonas sp. BSi20495]
MDEKERKSKQRLAKKFGVDDIQNIIDKIGLDELLNKMNGLRSAKAEKIFNSLLLSVPKLPERTSDNQLGTLSAEGSIGDKCHELTLITGISDSNNESIDNNKIYDELLNQDAANDPVIEEQPIQLKPMQNNVKKTLSLDNAS